MYSDPNSRYNSAERLSTYSHVYDENGLTVSQEDSPETPKLESKTTVYRLPVSQDVTEDSTYMAKVTDTFPLLAKRFYNDSTLWWRIAEANPHIRHPLDLKTADLVYIPV